MARAFLRLQKASRRLGDSAFPQCATRPEIRNGQGTGAREVARYDCAGDEQCHPGACRRYLPLVLRKPFPAAEGAAVEGHIPPEDQAFYRELLAETLRGYNA